ncbi:MAG: hypothetical protein BA868_07285 [Desulfobacterales bacterium C00003106]|nr:MAG: hypothetical protein BA868_07285 [Desulfobacterales bacterium C00003106]
MIITCENCQSKFAVDDERISETGSKVRCSNCKHVFEVSRALAEQGKELLLSSTAEVESPAESSDRSDVLEDDATREEDALPDMGGDGDSFDFDYLEEKSAEHEESIEDFPDFDEGELESGGRTGDQSDEFSETMQASEPEGIEDALELDMEGLDLEEASDDGPAISEDEGDAEEIAPESEGPETKEEASVPEELRASEPEGVEDALEPGLEEFDIEEVFLEEQGESKSEEQGTESLPPLSETKGSESAIDEEKDEFVGIAEDKDALWDLPEDNDETRKRKELPVESEEEDVQPQGIRRPRPFLLAVVILTCVTGGVLAALTLFNPLKTGFRIPYSDIVIGEEESAPKDVGNLKIALLNVKQSFENNDEAGLLFVVKGDARNDYSGNRSLIRIKGVVYDDAGNIIKSKSVYGGNVLTKTELEGLAVALMTEKLSNPSGMNESNVNVPPGRTIPFMVVFEGLPGDLGDFSVEAEASEEQS